MPTKSTNIIRFCLNCCCCCQTCLYSNCNFFRLTSGDYNGVALAAKVSEHLASVAVNFAEEPACVLLTTVILPVLRFVSKELGANDGCTDIW